MVCQCFTIHKLHKYTQYPLILHSRRSWIFLRCVRTAIWRGGILLKAHTSSPLNQYLFIFVSYLECHICNVTFVSYLKCHICFRFAMSYLFQVTDLQIHARVHQLAFGRAPCRGSFLIIVIINAGSSRGPTFDPIFCTFTFAVYLL